MGWKYHVLFLLFFFFSFLFFYDLGVQPQHFVVLEPGIQKCVLGTNYQNPDPNAHRKSE